MHACSLTTAWSTSSYAATAERVAPLASDSKCLHQRSSASYRPLSLAMAPRASSSLMLCAIITMLFSVSHAASSGSGDFEHVMSLS
ncbi:hypothetical protein FOA52_011538 [Chlamydomonas sp. UWO 241]|nr:hypothetical protein FOA52_011538 [Chlamydomonas sp. UWO 241]